MDERPVGILDGDDGAISHVSADVAGAVESVAPEAILGTAESLRQADPQFVVCVGESAVLTLARGGVSYPVLPVAAGSAIPSVPRHSVADAVATLLETDDWAVWTRSPPVLDVSLAGEPVGRALTDVTLVTSEPARISEYVVERDGEPVARFRADGVVVATPIGSAGYAAAAGGPRLEPGTDVGAVVPIAPFATRAGTWILSLDSVAISVCRDEGDVSLLVDDREATLVERDERVTLTVDGSIDLLCPPPGPGWAGTSNWKNSNGNPTE